MTQDAVSGQGGGCGKCVQVQYATVEVEEEASVHTMIRWR